MCPSCFVDHTLVLLSESIFGRWFRLDNRKPIQLIIEEYTRCCVCVRGMARHSRIPDSAISNSVVQLHSCFPCSYRVIA
jgi:hypothetical protein